MAFRLLAFHVEQETAHWTEIISITYLKNILNEGGELNERQAKKINC